MGDTQPPMTRPTTEPPRVRLRDITLADADLLDAWDGERSPYNDFGLPHDPTDREALARGPLRTERNGQLIVELVADGRPIGTVGWHREMYGPNPESSAFNFGIELIPEARGQGYGTEAQALLVDYLVRQHRRPSRRGIDRRQQPRGATVAREGRPAARGRHPRRPVPGGRLSRPHRVRLAARRPGGLTGKLARPAATVRGHGSHRRAARLLGHGPRRLPRLRAPDPARTGRPGRARQATDARRSRARRHPPARLPARGALPGRPASRRPDRRRDRARTGRPPIAATTLRDAAARTIEAMAVGRRRHLPGDVLRRHVPRPRRLPASGGRRRIGRRAGGRTTTRSPTRSWPATSRPAPSSRSARTSTSSSGSRASGRNGSTSRSAAARGPSRRLRVDDYMAYYRSARDRFLATLADDDAARPTRPRPPTRSRSSTATSAAGRPSASTRRREDDHLSLVAGITGAAAAGADRPRRPDARGARRPRRCRWSRRSPTSATARSPRVREQARIQLEGRRERRAQVRALRARRRATDDRARPRASPRCRRRRRATCPSTSRAIRTPSTTGSTTCSGCSTPTTPSRPSGRATRPTSSRSTASGARSSGSST